MTRTLCRVTLVGNVGDTPKLAKQGLLPIAHLSLVTDRILGGTETKKADWHRLTFLGRLARWVEQENIQKGDQLFIEGRLEYGARTVDVIVREVTLGARAER